VPSGGWSKGLTKETSPIVAEASRKISLALKGKPFSEEHKANLRGPKSPEHRAKTGLAQSLALARKPKSENNFAKWTKEHGFWNTGKKSPEASIRHRAWWASLTPNQRAEQVLKIFRGSARRPTRPEVLLDELIEKACPKEYIYTGDGMVIVCGLSPDFLNINGQKKVVELFGNHWHEEDEEEARIKKFKDFGFDCLVIWESDLKDPETVMEKVRNFNREVD